MGSKAEYERLKALKRRRREMQMNEEERQTKALALVDKAIKWATDFIDGKAFIAVGDLPVTLGTWTDEQLAKRSKG